MQDIQTIDDFNLAGNRLQEVLQWAKACGQDNQYVIIDDDSSLQDLPSTIKAHWVKTQPMIGLNQETMEQVLQILL